MGTCQSSPEPPVYHESINDNDRNDVEQQRKQPQNQRQHHEQQRQPQQNVGHKEMAPPSNHQKGTTKSQGPQHPASKPNIQVQMPPNALPQRQKSSQPQPPQSQSQSPHQPKRKEQPKQQQYLQKQTQQRGVDPPPTKQAVIRPKPKTAEPPPPQSKQKSQSQQVPVQNISKRSMELVRTHAKTQKPSSKHKHRRISESQRSSFDSSFSGSEEYSVSLNCEEEDAYQFQSSTNNLSDQDQSPPPPLQSSIPSLPSASSSSFDEVTAAFNESQSQLQSSGELSYEEQVVDDEEYRQYVQQQQQQQEYEQFVDQQQQKMQSKSLLASTAQGSDEEYEEVTVDDDCSYDIVTLESYEESLQSNDDDKNNDDDDNDQKSKSDHNAGASFHMDASIQDTVSTMTMDKSTALPPVELSSNKAASSAHGETSPLQKPSTDQTNPQSLVETPSIATTNTPTILESSSHSASKHSTSKHSEHSNITSPTRNYALKKQPPKSLIEKLTSSSAFPTNEAISSDSADKLEATLFDEKKPAAPVKKSLKKASKPFVPTLTDLPEVKKFEGENASFQHGETKPLHLGNDENSPDQVVIQKAMGILEETGHCLRHPNQPIMPSTEAEITPECQLDRFPCIEICRICASENVSGSRQRRSMANIISHIQLLQSNKKEWNEKTQILNWKNRNESSSDSDDDLNLDYLMLAEDVWAKQMALRMAQVHAWEDASIVINHTPDADGIVSKPQTSIPLLKVSDKEFPKLVIRVRGMMKERHITAVKARDAHSTQPCFLPSPSSAQKPKVAPFDADAIKIVQDRDSRDTAKIADKSTSAHTTLTTDFSQQVQLSVANGTAKADGNGEPEKSKITAKLGKYLKGQHTGMQLEVQHGNDNISPLTEAKYFKMDKKSQAQLEKNRTADEEAAAKSNEHEEKKEEDISKLPHKPDTSKSADGAEVPSSEKNPKKDKKVKKRHTSVKKDKKYDKRNHDKEGMEAGVSDKQHTDKDKVGSSDVSEKVKVSDTEGSRQSEHKQVRGSNSEEDNKDEESSKKKVKKAKKDKTKHRKSSVAKNAADAASVKSKEETTALAYPAGLTQSLETLKNVRADEEASQHSKHSDKSKKLDSSSKHSTKFKRRSSVDNSKHSSKTSKSTRSKKDEENKSSHSTKKEDRKSHKKSKSSKHDKAAADDTKADPSAKSEHKKHKKSSKKSAEKLTTTAHKDEHHEKKKEKSRKSSKK